MATDNMDRVSYKKSCKAFSVLAAFIFVVVICSRKTLFGGKYLSSKEHGVSKVDHLTTAMNRRLLVSAADDYDGDYGDGTLDRPVNRGECSKENIYVSQGQTSPLPNGIPTYSVQIQNICMSCSFISDIHLSCGWFSSARLINPNVFKRISYNDCLVNDGNPINPGQTISFQYANTYPYPIYVSSLSCYY